MKISGLYGKRALGTGGKQGYVVSVGFDGDKISCLVCADANEKEFTIDAKNIIRIGETVVFKDVKDDSPKAAPLRLGKACFDERGGFLGVMNEVIIAGNKIKTAKIGGKSYPAERLVWGDIVIVKKLRRLTDDVYKGNAILFGKGQEIDEKKLEEAALAGEYVQTTLKTL